MQLLKKISIIFPGIQVVEWLVNYVLQHSQVSLLHKWSQILYSRDKAIELCWIL